MVTTAWPSILLLSDECSIFNASIAPFLPRFDGLRKELLVYFSKGNFTGQCVWRWNKRSNEVSIMSDHYPTCSPDLTHCPDNQCDELERLDPRICPQDCTVECKRGEILTVPCVDELAGQEQQRDFTFQRMCTLPT